jgi:hypothetical protein
VYQGSTDGHYTGLIRRIKKDLTRSALLVAMSDQGGQQVELLQLDIEEILQFFISVTSTKSVLYLGARLTEDQEPNVDLAKARIAIDTTKMLVETLRPLISEDEAKQLNEVVSNLQLAYIKEAD